MKLLIIGSKGFIGSNIVSYFETLGVNVYTCDFFDIRNQENNFRINPANSNYSEIFEKHQFDLVINCAGSANVGASIENPFFDFDLNVNVVSKILGGIYQTNPKTKFINISSAAVYGNPPSLPVKTEFAENSRAISPYGIHKRLSEILLKSYHDSFGIPTCSLRIFSAYGNGQKKLLIWDLFQKFTENSIDKVELYGTGYETRDFIHINDIIQQIELVFSNAKFQGEALNIGNGIETSINEIAHIFKDCLFSNKEIKFNNIVREGDPLNWCADISELIQWGYEQNVNLKTGIMLYIKSNLDEKSN